MGWIVLIGTPHSAWHDFLPALIVAGLGMGGTFAPMTTVTMREVDPRMASAASGVLNTTRQVGSVIGTAAASCLAIKNKAAGQDRSAAAQDSQMAGTISSPGSPGSLGQSPGSSSGTGS
jgi:hypothetical protein